jgi:hypothetical protein
MMAAVPDLEASSFETPSVKNMWRWTEPAIYLREDIYCMNA